jgi:hypothetical protein
MTKAAELAKMGEVLTNSQIGGRRNIVINGAMQVAQRGTSFTVTNDFTLDRFKMVAGNTDQLAFTTTQSTTTPDGFANSLKVDVTTAESSLDSDELFRCLYKVEGQDLQNFGYGTSASESVTLSFYVRSNVTGTYCVEFRLNGSGTSTITKQYTINSANTWERKILTLPTNTATAINNSNGEGMAIGFGLAAGSNFTTGSLGTSWATTATSSRYAGQAANIMSSTDNEWYITGVQLEVGSQATPFEHRSFGEELLLCQRYYRKLNDISVDSQQIMSGGYHNSTQFQGVFRFEPHMRAAPSLLASTTSSNNSSSAYVVHRTDGVDYIDSIAFHQASKESTLIYTTGNTSGTQGVAGVLLTQESDNISELAASAEL